MRQIAASNKVPGSIDGNGAAVCRYQPVDAKIDRGLEIACGKSTEQGTVRWMTTCSQKPGAHLIREILRSIIGDTVPSPSLVI